MAASPKPVARSPRITAQQIAELAHPTRGAILELCSIHERTNKELAEYLGLDPATTLFHLRHLVDAGLLDELPTRRGIRGGRERPYQASATTAQARMMLEDSPAWQSTPIKVTPAELRDLQQRISAILATYETNPKAKRTVTVTIRTSS